VPKLCLGATCAGTQTQAIQGESVTQHGARRLAAVLAQHLLAVVLLTELRALAVLLRNLRRSTTRAI
jgi:hypothetical protein